MIVYYSSMPVYSQNKQWLSDAFPAVKLASWKIMRAYHRCSKKALSV